MLIAIAVGLISEEINKYIVKTPRSSLFIVLHNLKSFIIFSVQSLPHQGVIEQNHNVKLDFFQNNIIQADLVEDILVLNSVNRTRCEFPSEVPVKL